MTKILFICGGLALGAGPVLADDAVGGLADPTRPTAAGEYEAPAFRGPTLQSTIVSGPQRRALISGRTYGVGDRVGNAVIRAIEPYEVVLNEAGRETRLRLVPRVGKEQDVAPADTTAPRTEKRE